METILFEPIKNYTKDDIRTIRINTGMTQSTFAEYMGVTKKAVEAWESGRTHPTGPACRLLSILESDKKFIPDYIIIKE